MENHVSPEPHKSEPHKSELGKDELEQTAEVVEAASAAPRPNSFWLDFGPLLVFFVAFQWLKRKNPDEAMLWAAGIFAVAAVIALAIGWLRHKRLSGMLVFSTVVIVGFAGLALLSGNKIIFYMKPTIMNGLFGAAAIGGVLLNRNVIKLMIGDAFILPEKVWNTLAIRWGLFFFALAILNEIIWRTTTGDGQTDDFWVNFKVFGFLPLTIAFTLSQIPLINRHGGLAGLEKPSDG
jgi:intracellular septation protein